MTVPSRCAWLRVSRLFPHLVSRLAIPILLAAAVPGSAVAQSGSGLATRVKAAPNGTVRFTFRSRPNVCGSYNSVYVQGNGSRSSNNINGYNRSADVEWDDDCAHGPVRMVLNVHDHAVTGIHAYVGGRWRAASGVTDLGDVTPQTAVSYLLDLAQTSPESVGQRAIFPATLGDSVVVWPQLLKIARNSVVPSRTRKDAVFWLGQMAGDAVTANLAQLAAEDTVDRSVRKSAVFALSQQSEGKGVPALIQIARSNRDPAIRKSALFWLGQSNDPRALSLFETILAGSGKSGS